MGRTGEAVREIDQAQKLDPLTLPLKANAGTIYLCAHQYDRAIAQLQDLVEIAPDEPYAHASLGRAYIERGPHKEGLIEIQKAARLSGSDLASLGWAYAKLGRKADALSVINQIESRSTKDSEVPFAIATIYAGLGTGDKAFQWLRTAYERRSPGIVDIKCEAALDPFRSDPRYADLLRRMGLPQ
jgi:tetratricopeptide (TPR) repeat protein